MTYPYVSHKCPDCTEFVQGFTGSLTELRTPKCPLCGYVFDGYESNNASA
jgi:rubredoxin